MNPVRKALYILRYLGPRFVLTRVGMALRQRLGTNRRTYAPRPWDSIDPFERMSDAAPRDAQAYAAFKRRQPGLFLFAPGQPPAWQDEPHPGCALRDPGLDQRIDLLNEGKCLYFFRSVPPTPVRWHVNAFTGQSADADRPWYALPDFDARQGDIRTLWEPSRAAWAIDLARAAARADAVRRAELGALYDRWFESWLRENPPFLGPNWKCGQETAVRLIAHLLAHFSLGPADGGPRSWQTMARFAWASAYRIEHHIGYAVSQRNNHALSEACGLIVASHAFPEFRDAPRWRRLGRRVLIEQVAAQFYDDGSYIQHSMNYHRVALHMVALATRLCELHGDRMPPAVYAALARSAKFLRAVMDPATGRLPNYGNNDGALVLPLSECDFTDFRPAIQAAARLAGDAPPFPPGPWDEESAWLLGDSGADPVPAKRQYRHEERSRQTGETFPIGGYYTLRGGESWGMLRCHRYRDRPGQVDSLHWDLWWRGVNVLRDSGTYQYFTPENAALGAHFKSAAAHNGVELEGASPFASVSPFLWFPWPDARVRRFERGANGGLSCIEAECRDYARRPWRVVHRRTVIGLPGDAWMIVDDLVGAGAQAALLRWQLAEAPFEFAEGRVGVRLCLPPGDFHVSVAARSPVSLLAAVRRGVCDGDDVQGWHAPYYGERLAAPALETRVWATLPARLVTIAQPGVVEPAHAAPEVDREDCWTVATRQGPFTVRLSPLGATGGPLALGIEAA